MVWATTDALRKRNVDSNTLNICTDRLTLDDQMMVIFTRCKCIVARLSLGITGDVVSKNEFPVYGRPT